MAEKETLSTQTPEGEKTADDAKTAADEKAAAERESQLKAEEEAAGDSEAKTKVEAEPAQFSNVQDTSKPTAQKGLDFLLDIPLQISVELGRTKMLINDLLQLGQGSVVELSKLAGEPMEVLVNQKLLARGEVVVVNEKFGIRLTDIISPLERIERLK
jgi:flagellar motor switch protein FliN/FliY